MFLKKYYLVIVIVFLCKSVTYSQFVKNPDGSFVFEEFPSPPASPFTTPFPLPNYDVKNPHAKDFGGFAGFSPVFDGILYVTSSKSETEPVESNLISQKINLHIFYPKLAPGASSSNNPCQVIVFGYGGGFLSNYTDPTYAQDKRVQQYLASKGFIVVVPEYRLGIDLYDEQLSQRAIWRAVQDVRATIRYVRTLNDPKYKINPNKPLVYLGWSSGGFIGYHNLYLNNILENQGGKRPVATAAGGSYPYNKTVWSTNPSYRGAYDLGALDCPNGTPCPVLTQNDIDKSKPDITICMSGAIGNVNWINEKIDKPLYILQHELDGVVPFGQGLAFKNFKFFEEKSFKYPTVNGTSIINARFQNNPQFKPTVYKFSVVKDDCTGVPDCITGNAGTNTKNITGFGDYTIWHHDPTQAVKNPAGGLNLAVLTSITDFININSGNPIIAKISNNIKIAEDNEILTEIQINPNPVSGDVLNITGIEEKSSYSITNTLGQVVGEGVIENKSLSTAKLAQGNYFLTVTKGDERIVKQFIKN
jgi:Secretion system C-terminal sorting domain